MNTNSFTFWSTLLCIACDIFLMIVTFARGNVDAGMGWLCALLANMQVMGYVVKKNE